MTDHDFVENPLDETEIMLLDITPMASPYYQKLKSPDLPENMRFTLVDGTKLEIVADSRIILGRYDEKNKEQVNLDLNPHQGQKMGVSRYHAIIHVKDSGVFIQDTNSANGTFLNSGELFPMRQYALKNGDTISLGRLLLNVEFIY